MPRHAARILAAVAACAVLVACGEPHDVAGPTGTNASTSAPVAKGIPGTIYYLVGGETAPEVKRVVDGVVTSVGKPPPSQHGYRVSPDGKKISYQDPRADLYISNLDGSDARMIEAVAARSDVDWSPDSRRIVYAKWDPLGGAIKVVNADGSGMHVIGGRGISPVWSPDGAWIAFSSDLGVTHTFDHITVVRPDGSQSHTVTVAFSGSSKVIWGLQSMSAGGREALITDTCPDCTNYFPERQFKGTSVVDLTSGATRVYPATGGTAEMVHWLPDGGALVRIVTTPAPPQGGWAVYDVELRRPDGSVVARAPEPTTLHGPLTTYIPAAS